MVDKQCAINNNHCCPIKKLYRLNRRDFHNRMQSRCQSGAACGNSINALTLPERQDFIKYSHFGLEVWGDLYRKLHYACIRL